MVFLLGLAIVLFGFWFCVVLLGGDVSNFMYLSSLVIILFPILGVLAATKSFKLFYAGLRAVIFPKEDISEETRIQAVSLFKLLSKTAGMSAAVATLISLINILMNLDFSDAGGIAYVGINIAASLITLLYGLLLIAAVFEPMAFILQKRCGAENQPEAANQNKNPQKPAINKISGSHSSKHSHTKHGRGRTVSGK